MKLDVLNEGETPDEGPTEPYLRVSRMKLEGIGKVVEVNEPYRTLSSGKSNEARISPSS